MSQTKREAKKNLGRGVNTRKVRSVFIGARVPEEMKERLEEKAKELDRSMSWVIKKILARGVNTCGERDGKGAC